MKRKMVRNALGIALYALAASAQTPPATLQITAPANGVVVHPGDVMQVTVVPVSVPGAQAADQMLLAFEGVGYATPPAAYARVLTPNAQKTFQVSLTIPTTATPGAHLLNAIGTAANSSTIAGISNSITVNIARTDLPVRMVVEPALLLMTIPPDAATAAQAQLQAYLEYADGGRALVPAGPNGHLYFYVASGYLAVDNWGIVKTVNSGGAQIGVSCVACPGVNTDVQVRVNVVKESIQAVTDSLNAGSAGGAFTVAMTTDGSSYNVTGDTWIHVVSSISTDSMHWTTSIQIDLNPSAQPRIGTLHFSIAAGAPQDVVVYQSGTQ